MISQIRTATVVAALVGCFAFEPSHAGPPRTIPSESLSLSGLNLEKEADARILYGRLQRAALRVCHEVIGPMVTLEVGKCASELLDIAVSEVNRPTLTAVHGRPVTHLTARR